MKKYHLSLIISIMLILTISPLTGQISGSVKDTDGNPVDATVYLLRVKYCYTPSFVYETRTVDGYFQFTDKDKWEYVILVVPDEAQLVPGYFNEEKNFVHDWGEATHIQKVDTAYNVEGPYDIILEKNTINNGNGSIKVTIKIYILTKFPEPKKITQFDNGLIVYYLFNENGGVARDTFKIPNDNHLIECTFKNLDTGTYFLSVDYPFLGKDFNDPYEFHVSEADLHHSHTFNLAIGSSVGNNNKISDQIISPNPFSESSVISYQLSEAEPVRIEVYNSMGEKISTLVDEYKDAGEHSAVFNAAGLPQGMYYYTIMIGDKTYSGKMMLVR